MKKVLVSLFALFLSALSFAQSSIEVGFSRGNPSAKEIIIKAIGEANKSIYLAAYQFTSEDILVALISAKKRGVDVNIVVDHSGQNTGSASLMVQSSIACRVDHKFRIMHHKFFIVDAKNVELGSFNYTLSADKANAENALYIRDVPEVAAKYRAQWDWVYSMATPCTLARAVAPEDDKE
jgi:phosphatidylserine/phosphatidylglycerophosphate/cardiolipin synthase-like enzyme